MFMAWNDKCSFKVNFSLAERERGIIPNHTGAGVTYVRFLYDSLETSHMYSGSWMFFTNLGPYIEFWLNYVPLRT